MRFLLIILLLCTSTSLALAQRQLTTLTVNYAEPKQIVTAIKPLLSTQSSVSFYQQQLILNVTATELAKIRALLKQLDGAGRQLLVSLRTDGMGSTSHRSIDIDGAIGNGNTVITTGSGPLSKQTRTTVRVTDYHSAKTGNGNQSVRVTEGIAAYIATGLSAPLQTYRTGPDGRRYNQQDYVDAVTGFYATTWVNDDVVRISIDQSNNQLQGQTISTQQLQSQVSGALGQWLAIGVISTNASEQSQNIAARGQSRQQNSTQLYIKVELLE
jgi:hypothetical protein